MVIAFAIAGENYTVNYAHLTAVDAGDFRRAVGIPLAAAFKEGVADIDVIAGLVWLVRRAGDRTLTYEKVAATVNYGNVDFDQAADEGDPNSPEA